MAVSKVPTEVLTEIFYLLCKESIFVCELNNSRCKENFPWAVGLVCRQWRTAFLSYPPIWGSLTISDWYYNLPRKSFPKTRSESYAKEINRRLALYLERSGGYPLRLDILLQSDPDGNKAFTMMALEMLSACSHRWQTANFRLSCDWQLDSIAPCKGKLPTLEWLEIKVSLFRIHLNRHSLGMFQVAPRLTHAFVGPWAKSHGWLLPWTQLTELCLILDGNSIIENGDVPNLLPMLHNIKELRLWLEYELDSEFEDGFPQFPPTLLNQLHFLEVPHPAFLSWFEAPSLCEIYFADYQQSYDELLDVHGEISSLIRRSACMIRKLSLSFGGMFYVGTLEGVEELEINYQHPDAPRSPINISFLPKLRLLTIMCWIEDFDSSMNSLTPVLESARVPSRSECSPSQCSTGTPVSLLERISVELYHQDQEPPKIPKRLLEIADKWPVVVYSTHWFNF
ncbi:hypothetical protein M378DRAFT_18484 [Amanita muscaria Koide BX008]|uniref:F-box domain-containing protein n=1 Tax=Amanita muscaria (strain Koide BX008) TaxID=946122 RepID=A0A0C2SLN8_AMAMK|nr:hypothetical protein M378DRAFT_18484 [Amanita muscaria Koide BX008]